MNARARLTPYALLGVLTLGTGLGFGLGLSEAPSAEPAANHQAHGPEAKTIPSRATTTPMSSWSITPTPTLSSSGSNFNAVFCLSASVCTAVGNDGGATLMETWNGSAWSIVPSPNPKAAPGWSSAPFLSSVSCLSASACLAVGYVDNEPNPYNSEGTQPEPSQTFAETWNGSAWSIAATTADDSGGLNSVYCLSVSDCIAVGGGLGNGGTGGEPLVETWNGSVWSIGENPESAAGGLNSVYCVSASVCFAVGGTVKNPNLPTYQTLAEEWNGLSWKVVPSPTPKTDPDGAVLNSVYCMSKSSCTAVGGNAPGEPGDPEGPLVEHWNGSAWSIVSTPDPSQRLYGATLKSISCVSGIACTAVGARLFDDGPLVEHWNGSAWSIVSTAPSDDQIGLISVSCSSTSACTAVGYGGPSGPLVESTR